MVKKIKTEKCVEANINMDMIGKEDKFGHIKLANME